MNQEKNSVKIAWIGKHFGEEPPLTGNEKQGAGGIFFSGCNLHCVFCQNYQISQEYSGEEKTIEQLAGAMLDLEKEGAINIDLVSPTIWWKQIKQAIIMAKEQSLNIPIIWNSNCFESVEILQEMNGLVDIYLPDFKYSDNELAYKYSGIRKYTDISRNALKEMLKQTGNLKIKNNIAVKGVIVRHLILPNNQQNSFGVLKILSEMDKNMYISLMRQYYPIYKAKNFIEINRKINDEEFNEVYNYMLNLGFINGWAQEEDSVDIMLPDFSKINPFDY